MTSIYISTASFKFLPGVNLGRRVAGILIFSPVRGLRPSVSGRLTILNVPNPIKRTSSLFFKEEEIASKTLSTAREASILGNFAKETTFSIKSFLFTIISLA